MLPPVRPDFACPMRTKNGVLRKKQKKQYTHEAESLFAFLHQSSHTVLSPFDDNGWLAGTLRKHNFPGLSIFNPGLISNCKYALHLYQWGNSLSFPGRGLQAVLRLCGRPLYRLKKISSLLSICLSIM
jgi:hypothetical protein